MKYLLFISSLFLLMGCSQDKIKNLESKVSSLEKDKINLVIQLNEAKAENEELRLYISQMENDLRQINRYANSASQNANRAVFWFQSGESFLYQNHLREMSSDFNSIALITSKY